MSLFPLLCVFYPILSIVYGVVGELVKCETITYYSFYITITYYIYYSSYISYTYYIYYIYYISIDYYISIRYIFYYISYTYYISYGLFYYNQSVF